MQEITSPLHNLVSSCYIIDEFTADVIGSVLAEAVTERMASDIERERKALGLCTGNRYSPGYCSWSVKDQRGLFSLLPPYPCSVTLNDTCLMTPIKSVSGLIPVGRNVVKHPYGCQICENTGCRLRS